MGFCGGTAQFTKASEHSHTHVERPCQSQHCQQHRDHNHTRAKGMVLGNFQCFCAGYSGFFIRFTERQVLVLTARFCGDGNKLDEKLIPGARTQGAFGASRGTKLLNGSWVDTLQWLNGAQCCHQITPSVLLTFV